MNREDKELVVSDQSSVALSAVACEGGSVISRQSSVYRSIRYLMCRNYLNFVILLYFVPEEHLVGRKERSDLIRPGGTFGTFMMYTIPIP